MKNIQKSEQSDNKDNGTLYFVLSMSTLFILIFCQEQYTKFRMSNCARYTIAYPSRFVPRSTVYYYFTLNGEKIESGETMTFPTMGKFERGKHLMNERFWVQVYCKDLSVNRIYWDAKVPDTIQYIPPNGWDKIPYGLDKGSKE